MGVTPSWWPGLVTLWALLVAGCTEASRPSAVPGETGTRWAALEGCGNGLVEPPETCDDGNTTAGDGCSATCALEPGHSCYGEPSVCFAGCGDGALYDGEQCDDGNNDSGDGCAADCTLEPGYSCTGFPSVCAVKCGDGIKAASEACDDGNTASGDGCSSTCTVEPGMSCETRGAPFFVTRRGIDDCTPVTSSMTPDLPASVVQPIPVPGRYRIQYVSGAVSFSPGNWSPGRIGVNCTDGTGAVAFTLGFRPPGNQPSHDVATSLGFGIHRDIDAVAGDVRMALVDGDCPLRNNTNNTVTYRVDGLALCQRIPVITSTPDRHAALSTLTGTASPNLAVQLFLDASPTPVCTVMSDAAGAWTCGGLSLADGPHTAVATGSVLGSLASSAPAPFLLDRPPDILTPGQGDTVSATPLLSGLSLAGSVVTVFEDTRRVCGATADATGAWSCTPTAALDAGPHSVLATSTDSSGTVSSPSPWRAFLVDPLAPTPPVLTAPLADEWLSTATPTFSGFSEPGSQVEPLLDASPSAACMATATDRGDWRCVALAPLADGTYSVRARARDAAGNVSGDSSATVFHLDTRPPDTGIPSAPEDLVYVPEARFTFSSDESGVRYECALDEASFTACPADATFVVVPGSHTLRVRAVDAAGNVDPSPAEAHWALRIPQLAGGNCSTAPASGLGWAVLALVALRRRAPRG